MQFVNSRPNHNYNNNNNNNTLILPYTVYYKKPVQNNNVQNVTPNIEIVKPEKKMKWGEPTWYLFHTLAEKVKDEHFQFIRLDLLNTIVIICQNLPCPDCANHATEYMKKINFSTIKTKQDLKLMLFQFHNVVNKKKKFMLFSINDLDSKYSNANTINIIHNFMYYFQDKNHSIRMIANDIHRSRIAEQLKTWFNNNIQYFNV
jgi:hypothetical protein